MSGAEVEERDAWLRSIKDVEMLERGKESRRREGLQTYPQDSDLCVFRFMIVLLENKHYLRV